MIRQQFQRAEQLLLEARACASSWFGKARDEVTRLNDVAWAEHTLGNLYWHQGQTEQARDMYQSSIKLREQVIRQDPENRAVRGFLVETRVNLAQVESQAGNFAVADAEFQRVTDELQEIHEQKPDDVATRYSIAATCLNRSNLASARSNLPLAVDYCTQGIDTVQPVVDAQPDDHIARDLLCRLYGNRGIYRRLSEPDLAVVDWRNSVEYATTKDVRHYCQTMLIRSQVASGDVAEAFRCAQQAEMELPSPENQFRMAAAWSMIAQALLPERRDADSDPNVRRWHGSSMEHRPEVPQADAAGGSAPHVTAISEAFRHLRSLFAAGHFDRDASAREELRGGSDCNVLWVIILQ
jgi:tetratricopeptide (TPR) repeat protein